MQYYTPWEADEARERAMDEEESREGREGVEGVEGGVELGDEEGVESVASIDSIAHNADFGIQKLIQLHCKMIT